MQDFHGSHIGEVLSCPTYVEIKWSCYGEAVARLLGLCVAATAVCVVGAGHFIFMIMMNSVHLLLISIHNLSIISCPLIYR